MLKVVPQAVRGSGQHSRLLLHATLLGGLALCAIAFRVELGRGLAGHLPAWVYVVEWPFFAVFGVVIYIRLLREGKSQPDPPTQVPVTPASTDDPELAAWLEYVARLNATELKGENLTRDMSQD